MAFNVAELMATFRVTGTSSAVRDITQVQDGFARAGEAASVAGGRMDAAASRGAAGSAKLRAQQLSATAAVERFNTVLSDENASLARLSSAEASAIRQTAKLAEMQQAAVKASQESVVATREQAVGLAGLKERAGGALETMGKLGLGFAGFEAVVKGIELVKAGADFQRTMTLIATNANAGTAEVQRLQGSILSLAGQTATAPEELATSLYHVEQNGLRGSQALDVVKIAAEGAKVGMADVEATTNSMTAAVVSGIPGVQSMDQAMGALIATVGTGDMKMQDLNEALGTGILAVAKGYGLSLRDVGAALAVFGDNNIRGAQAATDLRMAIMAMAKPAATGKKAIESVGLSMDTLAKDMATGGLPKAVDDLNAHMKAAGVTGAKVGQFLTDAFGKKAGVGLAVLMNQVDRFHIKLDELQQGSGSFADKWQQTTQTAAFGFQKLAAEAQAAGIAIFEKVGPAAGDAAAWLGDHLPHAIHELTQVLGPLVRQVGSDLVGAWRVVVDVLKVASGALSTIGGFLSQHAGVVKDVGSAVLGMWVAWRGYKIVSTAVQAIGGMLTSLASNVTSAASATRRWGSSWSQVLAPARAEAKATSLVMQAEFAQIASAAQASAAEQSEAQLAAMRTYQQVSAEEIAAMEAAAIEARAQATEMATAAQSAAAEIDAAGEAASVGWSEMLGPIGLVVAAVSALVMASHSDKQAVQEDTQAYDEYKQALASTTTAVDVLTAAKTNNMLADRGAYDALSQLQSQGQLLNVTMDGMTAAVTGSQTHFDQLATSLRSVVSQSEKTGKGFGTQGAEAAKLLHQLTGMRDAYTKAVQAQKDVNAVNGDTTTSTNDAALAQQGLTTQINGATQAMANQKSAVDTLNSVLALLSGDSNAAAEAQLALEDGLAKATAQVKQNGTSLSENTAKGRSNLEWLHQQIDGMNQVASAQIKAGDSVDQVTTNLGKNEGALRKAAIAAGFNKTQVQALIDKYAAVPSDVKTAMYAETQQATTAVANLKRDLAGVMGKTVAVTVVAPNVYQVRRQIENAYGQPVYQTVIVTQSTRHAGPSMNSNGGTIGFAAGGTIPGYAYGGMAGDGPYGTVFGPGTETSDSIPAWLSRGEEVIRASQAAKWRPLLKAINAGTGGFASGGSVGSAASIATEIHGGKTVWIVDNREYRSEMAARNAAEAFARAQASRDAAALKALQTTQREYQFSYLPAFIHSLQGTTAALGSAGRSLVSHLAAAQQAHEVSSKLVDSIEGETQKLDSLAARRDTIASRLKAANSALSAAVQAEVNEAQSIAKSLGSFDISSYTAPQSTGGAPITGASIMAQYYATQATNAAQAKAADAQQYAMTEAAYADYLHRSGQDASAQALMATVASTVRTMTQQAQAAQAAANAATAAATGASSTTGIGAVIDGLQTAADKAKLFGSEMAELKKRGLNSADLQQLAAAGDTDATMQRLSDLLAATPDQIKQINSLTTELGATSETVGKQIATGLYGAGVNAAKGLVDGLKSQENSVQKQMQALGDSIVSSIRAALKIHSPSRVTRELGQYVGAGLALGLDDARAAVTVSANGLAVAAMPRPSLNAGVGREPGWAQGLRAEIAALREDVHTAADRNAEMVNAGRGQQIREQAQRQLVAARSR